MRVAVEGCAHGKLEKIYVTFAIIEARVDLLSCCGHAEEISRGLYILQVSSSSSHATLTILIQFADDDEKLAPVLVIFTGGNHEAEKRWLGGAQHLLRRRRTFPKDSTIYARRNWSRRFGSPSICTAIPMR